MTRILFAFLFAMMLTVTLIAGTVHTYQACTKDGVRAELNTSLVDNAPVPVVKHIGSVFASVAASMPFGELAGDAGYRAFVSSLTDEDREAFEGLSQPKAVGMCSAA